MRLLWRLWLIGGFGLALLCSAQPRPVATRYYIQLIWGTNREKPDHARYRPVGPKLKTELARVFQWQRYWEVNRQPVDVAPGKTAVVRLSPDCEVKIDFSSPGSREICIYGKGVLVARSRQNAECHKMMIHGAALETGGSWFVVVREDPPQNNGE